MKAGITRTNLPALIVAFSFASCSSENDERIQEDSELLSSSQEIIFNDFDVIQSRGQTFKADNATSAEERLKYYTTAINSRAAVKITSFNPVSVQRVDGGMRPIRG